MQLGIKLVDIAKAYEGNIILDELSFEFNAGGTYVIMGANGCGKSTLLRICALLEAADSGGIEILSGGAVLQQDLALRRRITLVLPKAGSFNTSVFNNVAYGLKIRGVERHERAERVEKMLAFIGLSHKRDQNALTLSSGEAQRLCIGRALVIGPDLLFLDEPTASVDAKNSEIIMQMIIDMKKEAKTTIVITTHDSAQAERLSSRLIMMQNGKLMLD